MAKILIVTDAWYPQVNDTVSTLRMTRTELREMGHTVKLIHPAQFNRITISRRERIRIALFPNRNMAALISDFQPDYVHIATEGILGLSARKYCMRTKREFTTSYHTSWGSCLRARFGIPESLTWKYIRWFHSASKTVMVSANHVRDELIGQGIHRVSIWGRGVCKAKYDPNLSKRKNENPRFIFVGGVNPENNLEDFLSVPLGSKTVVGDGPLRERLERKYPNVRFTGYLHHDDIQAELNNHDVLVFPSKTIVYSLSLMEANACGLPIAAHDVPDRKEVLMEDITGVTNSDLSRAMERALDLNPWSCRNYAETHSWRIATKQFCLNLGID